MTGLMALMLLGASWQQKLRAVDKQAKRLGEHGVALVALCDESIDQGRPYALSALRSELVSLRATVDRLDSGVRELGAK